MIGWRALTGDRGLYLAILGIGWFSAYVAVFIASGDGSASPTEFALLVGSGFALGAIADWHLSHGHNELGLVPFGSLGMSVLPLALAQLPASALAAQSISVGLTGAFLAWFVRPLLVFVRDRRSGVSGPVRWIAGLGSATAFALAGLAIVSGFRAAGLSAGQALVALACMNAAVALFIYRLLPEFLLRFIAWLLVHALYRLEREVCTTCPPKVLRSSPAIT